MTPHAFIGCLVALAVIAALATPAGAAVTPAGSARAPPRGAAIEEIVVTAERRAQRVQDVPISVTAITARQREDIGIATVWDIANFTPGFSVGNGDRPNIRGVGRQTDNLSVENAIATYVDGVWSNSISLAGKDPLLVERTEILRGPQGTLYGRNAIGGAINVISKRPTDEFEAEARVAIYNTDGRNLQGSMSGPITESVRYRVAFTAPKNDGFDKNVATGDTRGATDLWYAEGQIEWDILDNLRLWALYSATERHDDAVFGGYRSGDYVTARQYGIGALGPSAPFGFDQPGYTQIGSATHYPGARDHRKHNHDSTPLFDWRDAHGHTVHLDWTLDTFGLHYVYGDGQYVQRYRNDYDESPVTSYPNPTGPWGAFEESTTVFPSYVVKAAGHDEWSSHEISLRSEGTGPWHWIAGANLFHNDFFQPVSLELPNQPQLRNPTYNYYCGPPFYPTRLDDDCWSAIGWPFDPSPAPAPANPTGSIYYSDQAGEADSWAVFGQLDYAIAVRWQVTFGMRYTKDEKDVMESTRLLCFGNLDIGCTPLNSIPAFGHVSQANDVTERFAPGSGVGVPGVASDPYTDPVTGRRFRRLEDSWDSLTGTTGIQFTPSDDTLLYLRYSRGGKAGGFNAGNLIPDPEADEETLDAIEIGWKHAAGDRFQLYSSAFYYAWRDMQIPLTVIQEGVAREDLINLDEVDIYGAEFELQWQPVDRLFLMGSYAYLHTEIQNACCFVNPVDPGAVLPSAQRATFHAPSSSWTQSLEGNPVPQAPEHRVTMNASYNLEFRPGTLILSGTYVWRDEVNNDIFDTAPARAPDWDQIDLRATWRAASDRYTVIGFVRNATDNDIYNAAGASRVITGPGGDGVAPSRIDQNFVLGAQRTYGIEVHYRFRLD